MRRQEFPEEAKRLLTRAGALPRLRKHLWVVHAMAAELLAGLQHRWPDLPLDAETVLFGAATHDIGKAIHPEELRAPGNRHEAADEHFLQEAGTSPERARFARTHGAWQEPAAGPEDWLVALADRVWRGARTPELEMKLVEWVSEATGQELWSVYRELDDLLSALAGGADERLLHAADRQGGGPWTSTNTTTS